MKKTTPVTAKGLSVELLCGLPMLLFIYSGSVKLLDFRTSRGEMLNQPFPHWLAIFFAYAIPIAELSIVIVLIVGAIGYEKIRTWGLKASFVLMSLFSGYALAILLHLFPRIPCSCGGIIHKLSWGQHLILSLFFVVISLAAIVWRRYLERPYPNGQLILQTPNI